MFFFFKQKTAYEMRISDWSSDVCSSDLELSGISLGNLCHRRMINDDPVGIMTPLPMFRHDEKQRSQDEEMQQRFPQQPRAPTPLHSFRTGIDAQTQWAVVSSMLCVR